MSSVTQHVAGFPHAWLVLVPLCVAACKGASEPAGASGQEGPRNPNIVVVTIDTLRADHLGCYGYFRDSSPHLDAFARESVLFERCLAPMATTLPSHMSLFTATAPTEHGILANFQSGGRLYEPNERLLTLAMYLRGLGYETGAFVSALPLRKRVGIDAGFDEYSDTEGMRRSGEQTNREALAWLAQRSGRPFLLWVHYFEPHAPLEPTPPYDTAFSAGDGVEEYVAARRIVDTAARQHGFENESIEGINQYDGEVRSADEEFEHLLEALRAMPAWPVTVVLVLGDHGEGLNQHGFPGHGRVWDEQLHVPCLLRVPGVAPRRVPETLGIVDVLPTLLSLIQLPHEEDFLAQVSGVNVFAPGARERSVVSQNSGRIEGFEVEEAYCLTGPRWKLVRYGDGRVELYDHSRDPFELEDLAAEEPETAQRLARELDADLERQRERAAAFGDERFLEPGTPFGPRKAKKQREALQALSPEELEQMRTLGYAGGDDG
jgi:arylsulfatase A-like enzyme